MNIQDLIGRDYTVIGHGRWLKTAEHDSLVIDTEKQMFYWNSKQIFGDAIDWLTKIKGYTFKDAKDAVGGLKKTLDNMPVRNRKEHKPSNSPAPYTALVDLFYEAGKNHRDYWYNERGYTDETIDNFKLGYTGTWYTIPVFVDGEFKNFQMRKPASETEHKRIAYWYANANPLPFNFSILPTAGNWVVLTEGPPDAIMLRQNGIPAVSHTGGAGYWNPEWINYFNDLTTVYIVYDNNEAGRLGAENVAKYFGGQARIYTFANYSDGYDITDFFKNGGVQKSFMKEIGLLSKPLVFGDF